MLYTNNISMSGAAGMAQVMDSNIGSGSGMAALALGNAKAMSATQIDAVARDFESMFISQMMGEMFGDSVGAEAFGDSESADVYKGMMMDTYGKQISRSGGIGIADYIKKELLSLQEKAT